MTDPLALDPILPPRERTHLPHNDARLSHDERYRAFEAHVQAGGKVEADDWMPDEYRAAVLVRGDARQLRADGRAAGARMDPSRAHAQRKLALTSKIQDEVGHAQLLYRVAEDLGKPREQMLADLMAGKTKFHNVFHYPTAVVGRCRASSPGSWTPRPSSASRRCATLRTRRTRAR